MMNELSAITQSLRQVLRLVALTAMLALPLAHADEYSDVSQLVRSGKFDDALVKAEQYLVAKPRDPQMRFLKGVIQTEAGKPNDAIVTFLKLTEEYPELPEPYNNLAVLYAGQNQYDKARVALEMAIRTNPNYATAYENLGDVYAKLTSQAYGKALQLDGTNKGVQSKLTLMRDLFSTGAKGGRPASPAAASALTPTSGAAAKAPPAAAASAAPTAKPASAPASAPAAAKTSSAEKDIEAAVMAWAAAWSAKDLNRYLAAYGKDFDPLPKQSRQSWESDRRNRIASRSHISVKVSDLSIAISGDKASAKFRQDYRDAALNLSTRKTLDFVKPGDQWVIVKETIGA